MRSLALATGILVLFVFGCVGPAKPALTGDAIAGSLQASGLPVSGVVVYTAETDTNKLLGRPNQYTIKVSWDDTRDERANGNRDATIEVFATAVDLDARQKYTEAFSKAGGMWAQYIIRDDKHTALLRLPHALTPDQAKAYEEWLKTL